MVTHCSSLKKCQDQSSGNQTMKPSPKGRRLDHFTFYTPSPHPLICLLRKPPSKPMNTLGTEGYGSRKFWIGHFVGTVKG